MVHLNLNKSFYMNLIMSIEGMTWINQVREAYKLFLLNKSYGLEEDAQQPQIDPDIMEASDIQNLRTTGTGRNSRNILSTITRTRLLEIDET